MENIEISVFLHSLKNSKKLIILRVSRERSLALDHKHNFICVYDSVMIVVFHHSIVKATLEHAHNSMKTITEDFDKIEKQMNTPEVYDDDDRLSLKENVLKQKVRLYLGMPAGFGDRNCVELTCNQSFCPFARLKELTLLILKRRFPLNPKFQKFWSEIKWN